MDTATPQRYTTEEWRQNAHRIFNEAENSRSEWNRIHEQCKSLIQEKSLLTTAAQDAATKKLAEKARETREWKNKLERTIEGLTTQIKRLEMLKNRLYSAMNSAEKCAIIVHECLECRKQRVSTDLVEDQVHRELEKEAEMIENFRNLTNRYIFEAENQIQKNHAAKKELEKDWSDKCEAYNIDTTCGMMKNTSSHQIACYPGPEDIPSKWSTPFEWVDFTRENIKLGNMEIEASIPLGCLIEDHLKRSAEDLQRQSDVVTSEFRRRNMETNDCLYRLHEHLKLTGDMIAQAEKTINNLKIALLEKEPALKKVQTRLHLRYGRPNVELCQDPAQQLLMEESRILAATIQTLQEQLQRAEASLKNLLETRRDIEREISIKENTVAIDQARCPRIRQNYPQKHDLLGYGGIMK